ncbi:fungal-specific transcription factor domain-containing protein [Halenospora varia]|nr:fungal-specific transcription factor domain-containing protein [Halenospora varia]
MEDLIPEATSHSTATPRIRRRPALSCANCRRRKVRCDRKEPCEQCRKSRSATCTYTPEGLSSLIDHVPNPTPFRKSRSPLPTRDAFRDGGNVIRRESVVRAIGPLTTPETPPDDKTSNSERSFSDSHFTASGNHVDHDLAQRVERIEGMLSSAKINGKVADGIQTRKLPTSGLNGNMSKNRYYGHGHWLSGIVQAPSFMCFEVDLSDDDVMKMKNKEAGEAINSVLNNCKTMARAIKAAQQPQFTIWGVSFQHTMPERSIADELVAHYLRTHESTYRILHIPSFHKEYAQYWGNPQTTSTLSLIKILLVMAIGTCFYQGPDFDAHRTQAIQWIYTAQFWLASPNEKSRLRTAAIQVECLLLLARSIYNIGADLLWNHTGSVLRTAMSMGFHRDPKHSRRYSILHKEIRRRLWATILEINLQACLDSGMPPMISTDDFDTEPPSNINDDEIDESTQTRPSSHAPHVYTQSSLQIALLGSLATRLEIANLANDPGIDGLYERVLTLDKELLRTYKDSHSFLIRAAQDKFARFKPTPFHCKILNLKIQRFLLILHRPFATQARNNPHFYYSHKIHLDTAIAIHSLPSQNDTPTPDSSISPLKTEDDYDRFRLISNGFLKELLIHSIVIIYQEMISPLEDTLPSFSSSLFSINTPSVSARASSIRLLQTMLDLATARIEAGETAVKSHLLYSIALAHLQALEEGTPHDDAMTKAAMDSLAHCQEILRHRVAKIPTIEEQFSDLGAQCDASGFADGEMDAAMQDWGMEFEPKDVDSWLLSGWYG